MSNFCNLILNTDSYKASHYLQYPPDSHYVSSYIESRGGEFQRTVFFGLQVFLRDYLSKPISRKDIDQADELLSQHGLPFNRTGWEYILTKHQGYLPIKIEAVAEGTVMPVSNVMLQVVNTDPHCYWLTCYIETALLRSVWYPTTVATYSWHCKSIIQRYLAMTADDTSSLPYRLHDFGARGVSSFESAEIGGLAHLVNFSGTDTLSAILAAQKHYHEPMAAKSIPATEHSTMTCWGKSQEADAYAHVLQQFAAKDQAVSVVSDSYDLWHAIDEIWGSQLFQQVKDNPGVLVIRPDSGDPANVVTETLEHLIAKFGCSTNSKGYRVLPDNLRIIQGDCVNISTIEDCLSTLQKKGLSAENVAFGMGGALLQKINRDTLRFAMKANAIERAGCWQDVYKDPVTDHRKISKRGRLALIADADCGVKTIRREDLGDQVNLLIPVFKNGKILQDWSLRDIRQRAQQGLE